MKNITENYNDYLELVERAENLNRSDFEDEDSDYFGDDYDETYKSLLKDATNKWFDFQDGFETLLTSKGYSFGQPQYATTTSVYYTVWHEDEEERDIVIRFADHSQLYNADYSVDPTGITVEQLVKMINENNL
jgi:hypothetical protein